jgi:small subunit ribosomal protein S21
LSVIAVSSLPRTSRSVDRDGITHDISTTQGGSSTIGKHLRVFVRDNNVDQALRVLKKKMQREGVFREMKRRKAYEKPSERKTREKAEAPPAGGGHRRARQQRRGGHGQSRDFKHSDRLRNSLRPGRTGSRRRADNLPVAVTISLCRSM